jgi:hypothetical protein
VPEEEWEAFLASARSTLPATFRINGGGKFAAGIRDTLRTDFVNAIAGMDGQMLEGDVVQPPFPLPWCAARWLAPSLRGRARAGLCVCVRGAHSVSPNWRLRAWLLRRCTGADVARARASGTRTSSRGR